MDTESDGIRLRFWLWTAAMAALVLLYALRVAPELKIETDLLALLPPSEQEHQRDPVAAAAQTRYADALSRQLLFLLGAADAQQARQLARDFAGQLRATPAFASVTLEMDPVLASDGIYRGHRHDLLADTQRRQLREAGGQAFLDQALRDLQGPGLTPHALPVAQDPFNQFGTFLTQRISGPRAVRLENGVLTLTEGGTHYVLVAARTAQEPFSTEVQDQVIPVIAAAAAQLRSAGAVLLSSGVIRHAAAAARQARNEIRLVGTLSLVGVALMLLLTFRSLRPLLLGALVLASGGLAAVTLCQLVFGRVTLIALVFGSGLIGVAADYSTHFLADQFRGPGPWAPRQALRHVGPGIAMGMGCAVLGYLSLGLTPLPGLRQMALFSAAGLVVACCGVLCWYPVLAPPARRGEPLPLRWMLALDRRLTAIGRGPARIAAAGLALFAAAGLARVEFADDVRLLYSGSTPLLQEELRVRELLQGTPDSQFFLVRGPSAEVVLQREEQLRVALDAEIAGHALADYRAVSRALPSAQRQQQDHALLAQRVYRSGGLGPQLMQQLGFPPALVSLRLREFDETAPPLRIDEWLADAASTPWRDLWLGAIGSDYASIVSLSGIRDVAALGALPARLQGVQFVDRVATVSDLLARYRRLALLLLVTAYGLIGAALALRYGWRDALRLLAAPLGAALLTLAALGISGNPLNLFHILGLFVVLGLGVDYAVFLREAKAARGATLLAISLSTLGTILSYGLLAFSATPFIRAIGLTLLIGIGCTWLLALLLQRQPATASRTLP